MILLLTDGPPKHGSIQKQILEAIKKEVEMFKQEHRDTTFKVLTLLLGGDGQSKSFVKKLAQQTVRLPKNAFKCYREAQGNILFILPPRQ